MTIPASVPRKPQVASGIIPEDQRTTAVDPSTIFHLLSDGHRQLALFSAYSMAFLVPTIGIVFEEEEWIFGVYALYMIVLVGLCYKHPPGFSRFSEGYLPSIDWLRELVKGEDRTTKKAALHPVPCPEAELRPPPMQPQQYFFGEEYQACGLHVTHTAWLNVAVDAFFIILFSFILNLTVGYFDAFAILLAIVFFSVLAAAVYALVFRKYYMLWPIILSKVVEIILTLILLSLSLVLAAFSRPTLVTIIRWRLRTIESSTENIHIIIFFLYLIGQLLYSLLSMYIFASGLHYLRARSIFAYEERRGSTHAFLSRILSALPAAVSGDEVSSSSESPAEPSSLIVESPKRSVANYGAPDPSLARV